MRGGYARGTGHQVSLGDRRADGDFTMTASKHSRARLVAAAGLLVTGLAVLMTWPASEPDPVDVAILLAWNTTGVERGDGIASVVNDLGYTIALEELEITTYSVELI